MKRILRILAIAAICGILVVPQVEAQGRRQSQSQVSNNRGGNRGGGRAGGRDNSRPSSRNAPPSRPDNNNNRPDNRPGSGNSSSNRPGNNNENRTTPRPDNNRPDNRPGDNNGGNRPGNGGTRPGYQPNHSNRPGNNPGNPHHEHRRPEAHHHHNYHHTPPPHRPHYSTPWAPPRPPRGWRPGPIYPTFTTVLGISFGSSIDFSLSFLLNGGYNVYSYGRDVVYLSNVNQLNLYWPDATLYYGAGGLNRGEFIYSTSYYNTGRYNDAYARLVAAYGAPISTTYPSNGMQTCWFGYDGRFVTLQYMPACGADGVMRYYTTLSFGL